MGTLFGPDSDHLSVGQVIVEIPSLMGTLFGHEQGLPKKANDESKYPR